MPNSSNKSNKWSKIIAIANNKGGCGKTTTAQNIAAALRLSGFDVLAVDMDGQANLTQCFAVDPSESLYLAMLGEAVDLAPVRVLTPEGKAGALDLLPACQDLAAFSVDSSRMKDRAERLGAVLEPFRAKYDYILIDTPPAADLLAINALCAASAVIVPIEAQPLSVQGLLKTREHMDALEQSTGAKKPLKVLFTRFDRRKSLHRMTVETVRGSDVQTFSTCVRECVAFGESTVLCLDIFRYAPKSNGAQDYATAAAEVVTWKF